MNLRQKYENVSMYFYEKSKKDKPFYVWVAEIAEEHDKLTTELIDFHRNKKKKKT